MKYLASSFLCCLLSFTCLAQDPPWNFVLDEKVEYKLILEDLDIRKEILDGKEYGCFGKKETQSLLQLRIDFPKLQNIVKELRKLVSIKKEKITLLNKMNLNLKDQGSFLMHEIAGLRTELDDRDAWYRSIWFLVGLGAIVGSGMTTFVVYLVR